MTASSVRLTVTDDLLVRSRVAASETATPQLSATPRLGVAVVACMDARLNVEAVLGLKPGDAHVIRNAGGVVTEDVIRSLAISQRLLGTREVIVIQHTGCGMMTFTDEEFRHAIERETGIRPAWRAHAFPDLAGSVRRGVAHIAASPFLPHRDHVRGFVWDVATGALDEVGCDQVRESA